MLHRGGESIDRCFLNWPCSMASERGIEAVAEPAAQLEALVSAGESPSMEFKQELVPLSRGELLGASRSDTEACHTGLYDTEVYDHAMAKQPAFHFGSPATGPYFTGRDREVALVARRMRDHINVVVKAPRRYGKTSVLWRAADDVEASGGAIARIAVNQATSTNELTAELLREVARCESSRSRLIEFIGRMRVRPSMTLDGSGRMSFGFEPTVAVADARATLQDVVDRFAALRRDQPVALIFDEFQAVMSIDEALPQVFKAFADAHPNLSLVFCGSDRHLMEEIFIDEGAPLLGMAEVLTLEPLGVDVMAPFLVNRCASTSITMTDSAARRVCELAGPAPNDIQHLAYEAVALADPGIEDRTVDAALGELVSHRANDYAATFEQVTGPQGRLLRLLARGARGQLESKDVVREIDVAGPAGVRRARESLASRSRPLVTQEGSTWRIDDPFFAEWLRATDPTGRGVRINQAQG